MLKIIHLLLFAAAFLIAGCASVKYLEATGGSRADGVIELSYEYDWFEEPLVLWDDALIIAKERCAAWGYEGAEAFGGTTSQCAYFSGYSCDRFLVTAKYQCLSK